ncbi:bromodomain-containing protein [Theileria equi strain WA]|uniref:Bromodomain-containing protein n=1 Tax=Theileria equi strain WA TaxID=1537102 RepID=L0B1G1_THEEQ|nr:bromodomain-containing protein [Theileria equi strain WA]AFZ81086.1 bromodomain-containing protein [Theileria equi strain WA]|eukprot:XP_004830752.1 bromodomain-containing protein [Theileria equi strain WA]
MFNYSLVFQRVDVVLDFEQLNLKGSTHINARLDGEIASNETEDEKTFMLQIFLPIIGNALYKRVVINDVDINYKLVKSVNPANKNDIIDESCKNVDLLTFEGLHLSAQPLCDSVMYVEVDPKASDLRIDIYFEYYQMDGISSEIHFDKHWLLPRGSTNYKEYTIFSSGSLSTCWFPTLFQSGNKASKDTKYELNVTVPVDYSVISGFSLRQDLLDGEMNEHMTTKTYSFVSDDATLKFLNNKPRFGLFVGEFDFWNGLESRHYDQELKDEDDIHSEVEDEIAHLTTGATFDMPKNSTLIYVTLKGFGYLLESTNIATMMCLDVYKRTLDIDLPPIYLIYLPYTGFKESVNISASLRTQNYVDTKRCSSYTGSENHLHSCFLDSLTQVYNDMYYKSGTNMIVYSLDCLHSFSDISHDPKCMEKRIAIALGLSSLYFKEVKHASRDLHLNIILQSYLLDNYIKRNFGVVESKIRLWAKREAFATHVELYGDPYPLCTGKSYTTSHILMSSFVFILKAQLFTSVLDNLFSSSLFLQDNFIVYILKKWIFGDDKFRFKRNLDDTQKEVGNSNVLRGDKFWDFVRDEIVLRYVTYWNAKPQNRLSVDNQLSAEMSLVDIIRRGVEHDPLSSIITNYNNLVKSFVFGTGCPQVNMGFILQLQRKGTSMDHLAFRVDIKSLQPPQDVDTDGKTVYSLCKMAGISGANILSAYLRLARIMQINDQPNLDRYVYERVLEIFNINYDKCINIPHLLDFGDFTDSLGFISFSEVGQLRKNLALYQIWHDTVDLVGRDGNFTMGFGYIGMHPLHFCLGSGPLWDCVEALRQTCDINKIVETLVDNGSSYCGRHIHNDTVKRQFNRGRLPIASIGGFALWRQIYQQRALLYNPEDNFFMSDTTDSDTPVPLSAGFAKKWIFPFVSEIVEDDGVRENIRLVGDLIPVSYPVNPRAKRGRKKVALKGVAEDIEAEEVLGKNLYIGQYSDSDRLMIDWMKMLYMGMHPEMTQLDNRSVVAKVCSKTRLPLLWIRIDPNFSTISRMRRCQSSGMWEQQLLSDNNIFAQMEAACALGSFGRSEHFLSSESPLIDSAAKKLDLAIKRHKSHPSIRSRCLYSLVCLHNRDFRQHRNIQSIFTKYLSSFSINSNTVNQWHPSEARFMIDFFKSLALLRDKKGYSLQLSIDIFSTVLENMNGKNFLVHATNIVEACSFLKIPPCTTTHTPSTQPPNRILEHLDASADVNNYTDCLRIENLWNILWHLFRLDGIPGSCSPNRMLTSAFLICISRQPVFLSLCNSKFETEKDLGFVFDFIYFIPLLQHVSLKNQAAFELGQTYSDKNVYHAAIRATIQVLIQSLYVLQHPTVVIEQPKDKNPDTDEENPSNDDADLISRRTISAMDERIKNGDFHIALKAVSHIQRINMLQKALGILEAVKCTYILHRLLNNWELKLYVWDALSEVIIENSHSCPIIFSSLDSTIIKEIRNYLLVVLKSSCISSRPFDLKLFVKVHKVQSVLLGFGTLFEDDPKPDQKLVSDRLERLQSGLSMPKIAAFKRVHSDAETGSNADWQSIVLEAVRALKELPQAHWFLRDPEKSFKGYRNIVKHPTWLNKIESKAVNKNYAIPMQFKADMTLLFKNAKTFNKADSVPYRDVMILEEQFDTLWPCIVRAFQRNAKNP